MATKKKILTLKQIKDLKNKLKEATVPQEQANKEDEVPQDSVCKSILITFTNGYQLVANDQDEKYPFHAQEMFKYLMQASQFAEQKGGAFLVGPTFKTIKPIK